jgi:hypothetical protein
MLLCLLMDTARFLADPTYCISGNVKDNLHEAHANTHRLTDLVGMTLLSPNYISRDAEEHRSVTTRSEETEWVPSLSSGDVHRLVEQFSLPLQFLLFLGICNCFKG